MLAAELAALGALDVKAVDGGVAFGGNLALCYAANLESRVASRVLWQVGHARYRSEGIAIPYPQQVVHLPPRGPAR